jgi:hypothetical protein
VHALIVRQELKIVNPLVTSPLSPSGYTWTIASRVSDALAEAERRYGSRDLTFFYAGHEFIDGNPGTWYPGNRGHIVIQLGKECLADFHRAIYQLSHEVIHLLAPTGGQRANNLEEGLATWFSEDYCRRTTGQTIKAGLPCYQRASDLVQRMLEADPACIKSMRQDEPKISSITKPTFSKYSSCLSDEEVDFLLDRFARSSPSTRSVFDQQNQNGEQVVHGNPH